MNALVVSEMTGKEFERERNAACVCMCEHDKRSQHCAPPHHGHIYDDWRQRIVWLTWLKFCIRA